MRKRLAKNGYTQNQIDAMIREKDSKQQTTSKTTTTVEKWRSNAPTYAKIHRDYLSIDTLRYYEIPWEYDRVSPTDRLVQTEMCTLTSS